VSTARTNPAADWATWAVRAMLGMLGSGLVWVGSSIVLARERIDQHDRRLGALEERLERQRDAGRADLSKVAGVVEDHGMVLERMDVTLATLREKLDALLNRPRR
jgi:uncharacterized coiled-coil protein SlyX